ncbi:MAG: hypothetical protein AB7P17_12780 [Nitrospirales bacterium]|nr:hypothetical protein [Nitrospirales bacterium]
MATYNYQTKTVLTFLDRKANFTIQTRPDNKFWLPPILSASKEGCDPAILKDLMNAGADGMEIEQKYGWNSLILSANFGYLQAVEVLL